MGETTGIQWCDHTFNPWIGCEKVSPACRDCYAAVSTPARYSAAKGLPLWGPGSARQITSADNWKKPLAWDRKAAKDGVRRRVFCASLADVFEDRPDLVVPRARLWSLIDATRNLDWLLLTKRPENAERLWSDAHTASFQLSEHMTMGAVWQPNVWLGTTVENQDEAERRIPQLLMVPARVRFLSVEPMLGPVNLDRWFGLRRGNKWAECLCDEIDPSDRPCLTCDSRARLGKRSGIHWAIIGGESGPRARPFDLDAAADLVRQCKAAGVPVFVKQFGERWARQTGTHRQDSHGGTPALWPAGDWPREFPTVNQ